MYLEKVEMQGFKSFADKTEIKFEDNITAIVGPNGSGKSNVADAIRWVLGEQSAKSLRGGRMEDIIFSGTDKRRALGFAEVSIHFNNSSGMIPIDYSEVVVTRRMFRSGESEFYINKNACRLRDIRELFMDTGIGRDGYSIIGQGRIDEILSDRPADRRNIFEEAAGIVKFKSKKEETERKLEKTEENLTRINDLVYSISRQYKNLEKEAEKTDKYMKHFSKLKDLEVNIYAREISELNLSIDKLEKDIKETEAEISIIEKDKEEKESIFNELKEEINNIDEEIENIRSEKNNLVSLIERNKNNINIFKEKESFQQRDRERLENEIKNLNLENKRLEENIEIVEIEKNKIGKEYEEKQKEYEEINKSLKEKNLVLVNIEKELEEKRKLLQDKNNRVSQINNRLIGLKSFKESSNKRLGKIEEEVAKDKKEIKELEEELEFISTDTENEINKYNSLKKEKFTYLEKENKYGSKIQDLMNRIRQTQLKLEGMNSSYRLYQNMEESYEGYYSGVKNLLNAFDNNQLDKTGFHGVVADLLTVDKKYELAIDTTLGSRVQNIVIETDTDGKRFINFLRDRNMGRVTFLPLNTIRGRELDLNLDNLKDFGVLGLASDLVDYDSRYDDVFKQLLGRTIIVDNIDNATRLARRFNHRYRIVTLSGDILNPGGSMTGGAYRNNSLSIISRKNKIDELKEDIASQEKAVLEEESNLKEIQNLFNKNKTKLEEITEKLNKIEIEILQIKNKEESKEISIDRIRRSVEERQVEGKTLEEEIENYKKEEDILEKEMLEIKDEIKNLENILEKETKILEENKASQQKTIEENTELRIEINSLANKKENILRELENSSINIKNNKQSIEDKEKLVENINKELEDIDKKEIEMKEVIEVKSKEVKLVDEKLNESLAKKSKIMNQFYKEQEEINDLNNKLNQKERNKNKKDLELSKKSLSRENKETYLLEDYQLTFIEAKEMEDKSIDIEEIRPEVNRLKKEIKKLGSINPSALEEYTKVKEEYEFLSTQQEDLIESKDDLKEIIKDIEDEMEEKFMESFEIINKNFSKIFKILFNGGEASLELAEDDILETGIEINAQPPGKKLQNIRLLSGGEKSLTAVALLFAILEMKPSPFCILDEIDAALDDANIGRYTDYLESLNEETQFILITHRKTTMEISDTLYGVTMGEEGVSELYSVKMKDYLGEAEEIDEEE